MHAQIIDNICYYSVRTQIYPSYFNKVNEITTLQYSNYILKLYYNTIQSSIIIIAIPTVVNYIIVYYIEYWKLREVFIFSMTIQVQQLL